MNDRRLMGSPRKYEMPVDRREREARERCDPHGLGTILFVIGLAIICAFVVSAFVVGIGEWVS